jgi:hypothetical protein
MSYRWLLAVVAVFSACAQAGVSLEHADASGGGGDAKRDSSSGIDGPPIDGPTQCTTMTVNLLQNGTFEGAPLATMWTETRYQNQPIVRTDGVAGQSPTTKAWLGGLAPATDALSQDIAIPASATGITFTGYYQVLTAETGATVFDRGRADLVMPSGTAIESLASLDNAHPASTWTTISHPIAASIAGQTVRLKLSSTNDVLNASSFYFDTLALTATVCQ